MSILASIFETRIVAIIRGADPGDVSQIVEAILEGGVKAVEVTLNSKDALNLIRSLSKTFEGRAVIGAGTVLDAASAKAVIEAGAQFIVSPSLDPETIRATKEKGAVSIPGAFTATEILAAHRAGADIIKVFPASIGPGYIKDLRGPFPEIPLMPTGGVNLNNIGEFKKAGGVAFGIGSALVDTSKPVTDDYLVELRSKARKFVEAVL